MKNKKPQKRNLPLRMKNALLKKTCLASPGTGMGWRCISRPNHLKGFVNDELMLAYPSPVSLNYLSSGLDLQLLGGQQFVFPEILVL